MKLSTLKTEQQGIGGCSGYWATPHVAPLGTDAGQALCDIVADSVGSCCSGSKATTRRFSDEAALCSRYLSLSLTLSPFFLCLNFFIPTWFVPRARKPCGARCVTMHGIRLGPRKLGRYALVGSGNRRVPVRIVLCLGGKNSNKEKEIPFSPQFNCPRVSSISWKFVQAL